MKTAEIYALCCPLNGDVRYIGKGNSASQRLKQHLRDSKSRKTPVYDWIRKLQSQGLSPALRVLETVPHSDWQTREMALIAQYREKFKLLNLADGGDEPHCTTEQRASAARAANAVRAKWTDQQKIIFKLKRTMGSDLSFLRRRVNGDTDAPCFGALPLDEAREAYAVMSLHMQYMAACRPSEFAAWASAGMCMHEIIATISYERVVQLLDGYAKRMER